MIIMITTIPMVNVCWNIIIVIVVIGIYMFLNDFCGIPIVAVSSGNFSQKIRKTMVEECLTLCISDFSRSIYRCFSGTISWINTLRDSQVLSIKYLFLPAAKTAPLIILTHEEVGNNQSVSFQSTVPNFGGKRWWFSCPNCNRRVGKLYRSQIDERFLCRHCHGLIYRSFLKQR